MSGDSAADRDLAGTIADMDSDLHRLLGFARAFRIMGSVGIGSDIDADAVGVLGEQMEDIALRVKTKWTRAFELSRPGGAP